MELLYDKSILNHYSIVKGLNINSMIKVLNKILNLEKITFIKGITYETRF